MQLKGAKGKRARATLMEYLESEKRGFGTRALCDPDLLACCALAHLEFENAPQLKSALPLALRDVAFHEQAPLLHANPYLGVMAARVLDLCGKSQRLRDVQLLDAQAAFDLDEIVQFGACSLLIRTPEPVLVISFRGTGTELTGWHEDFNLAVMETVPAQRKALAFLVQQAQAHPYARIVLCGHSKGGALAEYAALFCAQDIQERIEKTVAFDAPGLFKLGERACADFAGYDAQLQERYDAAPFSLVRYVFPAFVGLMLDPRPLELMRYCTANPKSFPHDMDSVVIEDGEFVLRVPSTRELMRGTALNRWLEQMSLADRQCFIDSVFAEVYASGLELEFVKLADLRTWAWLCSMHFARSGVEIRRQLGRIMGLAAREFGRT